MKRNFLAVILILILIAFLVLFMAMNYYNPNNSRQKGLAKSVIFEVKKLSFSKEPKYNETTELALSLKLANTQENQKVFVSFIPSEGIEFLDYNSLQPIEVELSSNSVTEIKQRIRFSELGAQAISAWISVFGEKKSEKIYLAVSEDDVKYSKFPMKEHMPKPIS